MRPDLPSVDELLARMPRPRVHPNGFIQLDLDERTRLHVWHPNLPYRQKTFHPIHDHVFSFKSYIYSGRLVNVPYYLTGSADGTHNIWQVRCTDGEETVLAPVEGDKSYLLVPCEAVVKQPGESYRFNAHFFHEILFSEPTLTIIVKDGKTLAQGATQAPCIMVPVGVQPDNDFRRDNVSMGVLWDLIREAMPS